MYIYICIHIFPSVYALYIKKIILANTHKKLHCTGAILQKSPAFCGSLAKEP